jgi:hypothetical protein
MTIQSVKLTDDGWLANRSSSPSHGNGLLEGLHLCPQGRLRAKRELALVEGQVRGRTGGAGVEDPADVVHGSVEVVGHCLRVQIRPQQVMTCSR